MDALRLPPPDADVDEAVGRRAAPRRAVPAAAASARPAAARRADQPPRRRDRSPGSSASCKDYPGTVVAVTHDRYFLDNVAGWILELDRGARHPVGGQLLVVARAEAEAARSRRRRRSRRGSGRSRASSSGCAHVAARAPGEEQGAPRTPTRSCCAEEHAEARGHGRDQHPARARASATSWSRPSTCARATATTC